MPSNQTNFKFAIKDSSGAATSTIVDMGDMFVPLNMFLPSSLFAWGSNYSYGALGNASSAYYSSPIQIGTLSNWKTISGVSQGAYALKTDGTIWSWGYNAFGQLGNGTTTNYSSPIQIGTLSNWNYISSGWGHMTALKNDGTLWVWGFNGSGQLGDGTTASKSSPLQIGSNQYTLVSGVGYSSYAIDTTGALWAWGNNNVAQLGLGDLTNRSVPTQVGTSTDWQILSQGATSTTIPIMAGIKEDGTLWTWGNNTVFGWLGIGLSAVATYASPIQVGTLTNWRSVAVMPTGTIATKTDGTLWIWGQNTNGMLGIGSSSMTVSYSSPIQIGALTNWKSIVTVPGSSSILAVKTDGSLWFWGGSFFGESGFYTSASVYYSSPVQVGSLTSWRLIKGGGASSYGIISPDLY